MEIQTLEGLTRVLQACIAPVAMVSGVGLLILTETNRFSRITDRLRELAHQRRTGQPGDPNVRRQMEIFLRRARLLRAAIGAAVGCAFLAGLQVLVLFAMAVFGLPMHWAVLLLFAFSLISLIVSLGIFLADMRLSLEAIEAELAHQ